MWTAKIVVRYSAGFRHSWMQHMSETSNCLSESLLFLEAGIEWQRVSEAVVAFLIKVTENVHWSLASTASPLFIAVFTISWDSVSGEPTVTNADDEFAGIELLSTSVKFGGLKGKLFVFTYRDTASRWDGCLDWSKYTALQLCAEQWVFYCLFL